MPKSEQMSQIPPWKAINGKTSILPLSQFVKPHFEILIIQPQIVTLLELRFILFLLIFFDLQQGLAFLARSSILWHGRELEETWC